MPHNPLHFKTMTSYGRTEPSLLMRSSYCYTLTITHFILGSLTCHNNEPPLLPLLKFFGKFLRRYTVAEALTPDLVNENSQLLAISPPWLANSGSTPSMLRYIFLPTLLSSIELWNWSSCHLLRFLSRIVLQCRSGQSTSITSIIMRLEKLAATGLQQTRITHFEIILL